MLQVILLVNGMTVEFEVINLFATPVAGIVLDHDFSELNKFKDLALPSFNNAMADEIWSLSQGLEPIKEPEVYVLDKVPKIKKYLTNIVSDYLNRQRSYTSQFVINTSWLTRTHPKQRGQQHDHIGHCFSGVLYFDDYDNQSSNLTFYSPLKKINRFNLPTSEDNPSNWTSYKAVPSKNLLLIFPSYLDHQIEINYSDKIRYSLAFNVLPVTEYNVGDSLINIQKLAKQKNEII